MHTSRMVRPLRIHARNQGIHYPLIPVGRIPAGKRYHSDEEVGIPGGCLSKAGGVLLSSRASAGIRTGSFRRGLHQQHGSGGQDKGFSGLAAVYVMSRKENM